jgi:hypothetical protein
MSCPSHSPPSVERELGPLRDFLISAARRGASVFKMRDVSRHKSMDVLPMCATLIFSATMSGRGCCRAPRSAGPAAKARLAEPSE